MGLNTDKAITLMLAEDHKLVRDGVISMLKDFKNMNVIGAVDNGKLMLELLKEKQPDIILTDLEMPEMDGLELMAIVKSRYPKIKIIVISMHYEVAYAADVMAKGANAFLPKEIDIEELVYVINSVYHHEYYCNKEILKTIKRTALIEGQQIQNIDKLSISVREREVLKCLCDGLSNKQVADTLNISEDTVESHRKNIYKKTNCRSFAELVKLAIRSGITHLN
jgi:DNA-binding NarL/FixJ family response regulator